ncbi:hypothetical protein ABT075_10650 [Streptomyces sp. NPDC002677]|uniref:hypothetical protein n=1 Tax=Streptomyces sp. NPDC002677 TaxID=3154774 RepID=UPI003317C236
MRSFAQHAFVSGMTVTMWICAMVRLAAALLSVLFLPRQSPKATPEEADEPAEARASRTGDEEMPMSLIFV